MALDNVNLTVQRSEIVGLIGPNGAGKTTCVNVITGFQKPSSGQVMFNKNNINEMTSFEIRRIGLARTFQAGRMFTGLTVMDNLVAPGVGLGYSRTQSEKEALDLLEWVGISHLKESPAAGLPYTDERRVGIARALMYRPEFILLDEPAAGMSEAESSSLSDLIKKIALDFNCGVLLIEHNVNLVLSLADSVYVLDAGTVIEHGDKHKILESKQVREAYLGSEYEVAH